MLPFAPMNLLKALATVSGMTLLSRILGFVRDFVIARTFGAGMMTDAFFIAFKLPNLLRRLFAEGHSLKRSSRSLANTVTSAAMTRNSSTDRPCCNTALPGRDWRDRDRHSGAPSSFIAAPGFAADAEKFELTVKLLRICFSIHCVHVARRAGRRHPEHLEPLCAARFYASPAQCLVHWHGAFAAPYFDQQVLALGWAVVIGGLLQLSIQIPALMRIGMLPRFAFDWKDEASAASCC